MKVLFEMERLLKPPVEGAAKNFAAPCGTVEAWA